MKLILVANGDGTQSFDLATEGRPVYTDGSPESEHTAKDLFSDPKTTELMLLKEQADPESRKEAKARAAELLATLRRDGRDAILILGPRFLKVLCGLLQKEGYVIARSSLFSIRPYERIRATEKTAHCGYCAHNCPLSNPGCAIGQERAGKERR